MSISRRRMLSVTGYAAAGALVLPPHALANPVVGSVGLRLLKGLVVNVGYNLVSSAIYDFIKSKLEAPKRRVAVDAVRAADRRGFDPQPYVYSPLEQHAAHPYYVYPLDARTHRDDGAMQFWNYDPRRFTAGMVSGPTLAALSAAATDMVPICGCRVHALHDHLMPRLEGQFVNGCFYHSYDTPETFTTADGVVSVAYRYRRGEDHGHARCVYSRWTRAGYLPVLDHDYRIALPA